VVAEIKDQVAGLLGGPFPGWMQGEFEDVDAAGCVVDRGQDVGLRAVEQVDGEESRARIAPAWECRNCDQAARSAVGRDRCRWP
jgi:hypothetical protein